MLHAHSSINNVNIQTMLSFHFRIWVFTHYMMKACQISTWRLCFGLHYLQQEHQINTKEG